LFNQQYSKKQNQNKNNCFIYLRGAGFMILEDEQYALLARFVEAHRNTPRESRGKFIASVGHGMTQAEFIHLFAANIKFKGSISDAEILADAGLLKISYGSKGDRQFAVSPEGIKIYEQWKASSPATQVVLEEPKDFISTSEFKKVHGEAFAKWDQAASLLWSADSNRQWTTIGHLCREALQEFAKSLAYEKNVDVTKIDPISTVERLRTIIKETGHSKRSKKVEKLLDALIVYWGTLSDLVQRQEHGANKEGEQLLWEDARRVVFHTCVVMFELSRSI